MGEVTEEKLIIENDTFALKREYKYALENLTKIKKDIADSVAIREKVNGEVSEKKAELTKVSNQIAEEKNEWAQHRHAELLELENKQSEANNVLKRKTELNEQEEEIRKLKTGNETVLNENRALEFKLRQDKTALEVKEREIEEKRTEVINKKEKMDVDRENFKNKVIEVLNQVQNL